MKRAALVILGAVALLVWLWGELRTPTPDIGAGDEAPDKNAPELAVGSGRSARESAAPPQDRPSSVRMPRRVRGVIRDKNGDPIPNVAVHYLGAGKKGEHVLASEDGQFEIAAVALSGNGAAVLHFRAGEAYESRRRLVRRHEQWVVVTLEKRKSITVHLVDHNGSPVERTHLYALEDTTAFEGWDASGRTDERGVAKLKLRPGRFFVYTTAPDPSMPSVKRGPFSGQEGDLVIRLPRPTFIEGTVLAADGQPTNQFVAAFNKYSEQQVWSDEQTGAFRVGPLDLGRYDIVLRDERDGPNLARVQATAPSTGLRIKMPPMTVFQRAIRIADDVRIARAEWIVGDEHFEIGMNTSAEADWLRAERVPDVIGTLLVRDSKGAMAYYPGTRLRDLPPRIVLRPGVAITGTLDCDDFVNVAFRMGPARIPGVVDLLAEEGTVAPFKILVPAGAEGTIEVYSQPTVHAQPTVYYACPASAGQTGIRLRVRTPD